MLRSDAPLLLLLPGMDGTGRLFARFARALEVHFETRVVAYPLDEALDYDALLARIAIPSGPFVVVAESFSGPIGIALAAARHASMRALVLAGSFARSPWPQVPAWLSVLVRSPLFAAPPPRAILRRTLLDARARDEDVDEVRDVLRSVHPQVLAARLRAIARADVRAAFAKTTVPVLSLVATRDRLVPRRVSRELRALRPDLEEVPIDAPHFLLQERPGEAAAAVTEFVYRL